MKHVLNGGCVIYPEWFEELNYFVLWDDVKHEFVDGKEFCKNPNKYRKLVLSNCRELAEVAIDRSLFAIHEPQLIEHAKQFIPEILAQVDFKELIKYIDFEHIEQGWFATPRFDPAFAREFELAWVATRMFAQWESKEKYFAYNLIFELERYFDWYLSDIYYKVSKNKNQRKLFK